MTAPRSFPWRASLTAIAAGLWAAGTAAPDPSANPPPPAAEIASAHGAIRRAANGYRCAFDQAPAAEVVADIARAWAVPVAYFGPPGRRLSATFTAPTAAAALLQLADHTDLRVAACGGGWCLEDLPDSADPPLVAASWAQKTAAAP
jgi:hypothetical protein